MNDTNKINVMATGIHNANLNNYGLDVCKSVTGYIMTSIPLPNYLSCYENSFLCVVYNNSYLEEFSS